MTQNIDKTRKKRQPFTQNEDNTLRYLVNTYGENDWGVISIHMGGRTARQCRDRWREYLMPSLNSSVWSTEEDSVLLQQIQKFGRKWSLISSALQGRSETSVKNRWRLLERRRNSSKGSKSPLKSSSSDSSPQDIKYDTNDINVNHIILPPASTFQFNNSSREDLENFFKTLTIPSQSKSVEPLVRRHYLYPQLV